MAQEKKKRDINIEAVITKAVDAGIKAGRMQIVRSTTEAYRATEGRLYAYPILISKNAVDKEYLCNLQDGDMPKHSNSIVRFSRSGSRLSKEDMLEALIKDTQASIAADEHEIQTIRAALETIADDVYYLSVGGKYIDGMSDEEIAETIPCDPSTVRRNRGRLLRALAVWLYGSAAL